MRVSKYSTIRWAMAQMFFLAASLMGTAESIPAQKQNELSPPKVEGKIIVGGANFGEEIPHGLIGSALRIYVTKRLSVEPEYLYLRHSENDEDQIFQANVATTLQIRPRGLSVMASLEPACCGTKAVTTAMTSIQAHRESLTHPSLPGQQALAEA